MIRHMPVAFLVLDLSVVLLHVVTGWPVFDLDKEGNLPTWYSSMKLLAFAALASGIYAAEGRAGTSGARTRWLWALVSVLFVALSADETASLHERTARWMMRELEFGLDVRETLLSGQSEMDAFAWPALFSPVILGLLGFLGVFFWRRLRGVPGAIPLAFAGIAAYATAIGLEALVFVQPSMAEWSDGEITRYRWLTAIEEGFEFLGTTALFAALVRYRLRLRAGVSPGSPPRTSS